MCVSFSFTIPIIDANSPQSTYMALIAREVYFLPVTALMATQVTTIRKRVFLRYEPHICIPLPLEFT